MAFTIKIYEQNEYLYSLLKKRLMNFFPDAYIVNPFTDGHEPDDRFSDYTRVIYDPADITKEDISRYHPSPIRLTEDSGIIDCSYLIPLLRSSEEKKVLTVPVSGSLFAVLPFVYSEVRDRFLSDLITDLSGADFNVRLDFTSKFRALCKPSAGCNMTSLLEACRSRKFRPEDILKYCNLDDYGYLTPGSTINYDDVYDLGIQRSAALMQHAASLTRSNHGVINVVAVIEGFRSGELPELLCSCDKVFILLPAQNNIEDPGTGQLITLLTKILGHERLEVIYSGNNTDSDTAYGTDSPGRLVV